MIHTLKNLGVAITAVLAVAAMAAPAASAAEFHTGFVYSLSGSQVGEDKTTFNAGTLTCLKADYTGELRTGTVSTLSLAPSYSECKAFGFVSSSVDTNGCEYVFHAGEEGSTEIVCPAGKSIVVTAFNCEVTIGPQSLKSVSYTNEETEGSNDIRFGMNLTGLSYTQHSKGFPACNANSTNPRTDGKVTGQLTLKASAVEAGIWHE